MYGRVKVAQEERAEKTEQAKAESDLMKLLCCPFCGGIATTKRTYISETGYMAWYVGCYSRTCLINPCAHVQNSELSDVGWGKSKSFMSEKLKKEAISRWNTRT